MNNPFYDFTYLNADLFNETPEWVKDFIDDLMRRAHAKYAYPVFVLGDTGEDVSDVYSTAKAIAEDMEYDVEVLMEDEGLTREKAIAKKMTELLALCVGVPGAHGSK